MKVITNVSTGYASAIRIGVLSLDTMWRKLIFIRDFTFVKHVSVQRMKSGKLGIILTSSLKSDEVSFVLSSGQYACVLEYQRSQVSSLGTNEKRVLVTAEISIYPENEAIDNISILDSVNGYETNRIIQQISADIQKLLAV